MTTDGRLTDGRLTDGTTDPGDPINPSINLPKHNTGPDGPPGRGDDRPQVVRGPGGGRARGTPAQGTHVGWSGVWVLFFMLAMRMCGTRTQSLACVCPSLFLWVYARLSLHTPNPFPTQKQMGLLFPPKFTGPNAPTADEYKSGKVRPYTFGAIETAVGGCMGRSRGARTARPSDLTTPNPLNR